MAVAGNVLWAAACYTTGGLAFLVSLDGIALSTAATATTVRGQDDFYKAARGDIDAIFDTLKKNIHKTTSRVHAQAESKGWDEQKTWRVLMRRLLKEQFVSKGAVPVVDSPRIAARVERDLFLKLGSTKSRDVLGWSHGDWWVEYHYTVSDAWLTYSRAAPPA